MEGLEGLLGGWPGSLVVASHDRALLEGVCGRLLVLQGQGPLVRLFDGPFSQVRVGVGWYEECGGRVAL